MSGVTFTTRGALNKSALRQANERLVLNAIRQNPSVARSDIVRITGLSPSSVTFILKRLKRERMISEEKAAEHAQLGRRPTVLRLRPDARLAIGAEISRSGARVALADFNGQVLRDKAVAFHPNPEIYFDRVHAAIRSLVDRAAHEQMLGVGVGLPGTIDPSSGRVIAAENLGWFRVEAGARLRGRLPFPFYYENLAKLAALGEMWVSERDNRPLHDFVSVVARGGIGTGVIINGQLLQGAHSAASEFGHTTLYADGRRCACGNTGCWEQYASDFALCRLYAEMGGQDGSAAESDAAEIIRRAREGDAIAQRALDETARHAGTGFANLIWALDPEAIVVGGWIAEAWSLIEDTVWASVRSRVAPYCLSELRILPSQHAADAGLLGAVALVLTRFFTSFDPTAADERSHSVVMSAQRRG
jgi:predicted NBD/HSP70 family sugar kinase